MSPLKLWKARRSFSSLIRVHEGEQCSITPWLVLLRENNELARQRIRCQIPPFARQLVHPLVFLLLAGADAESIREVYNLYPDVLSQEIKDDTGVVGLPLHAACGTRSKVSEKVLLFLMDAYPKAVLLKNSAGDLPIHLLLANKNLKDNRKASLREVVGLLDLYERGVQVDKSDYVPSTLQLTNKKQDKGSALSVAFSNATTQRNVLALLASRFPKDCNSLFLGKLGSQRPADNLFTVNHLHASLICKLLPQLTTFHCAAKHWYPRAVPDLMKGLCQQRSLVNLTLRLPNPNDDALQSLQQLVEENTTLQYLHLDFGADYTGGRSTGLVGGVETALMSVLKSLTQNDTLQECHFSGVWMKPKDPDFFINQFWPTLAKVLRERNTMLETVTVSFFQRNCAGSAKDRQEVQHWTSLNPYGRALFRNAEIPFASIVSLLGALNNSAPDLEDDPTLHLTVLYGLLRENPSLWCDKNKRMEEEEDSSRGQKRRASSDSPRVEFV